MDKFNDHMHVMTHDNVGVFSPVLIVQAWVWSAGCWAGMLPQC